MWLTESMKFFIELFLSIVEILLAEKQYPTISIWLY